MKTGIAIYSNNLVVIDGHVWIFAGRNAEYIGEYGAEAHLTPNAKWGKRVAIAELDQWNRVQVSALITSYCTNPQLHSVVTPGTQMRLR